MSNSCFERGRLRHADGGSIQICPFPTHGGKQFIADRQVDQAANGCLVADQGNSDTKERTAMLEIGRAIQGVNNPILDLAPGLPQAAVEEDGGGFLAWAFEQMQDYLNERKRATFGQVMRKKLAWLGQPQVAA